MNEIILLGGVRDVAVRKLEAAYRVHNLAASQDRAAALKAAAHVRAAVTGGPIGCDAATAASLPNLKVVVGFGVGYDKVDMAALKARGIPYTNTPGATDACVADVAFGLLLALARGIVLGDAHVRSGAWMTARRPLMHRVTGRKLGILGLGNIGLQIAKRGAAFDMPIGYHNRKPRGDLSHRYFADLIEMARWADILVVACPGGAATRHLVNDRVLDALGRDGVVINIARGSVIDQAALARALADKRIAGAGLDVFEDEPCHPANLIALDNVVLTPHVAGSTEETWDDCEAIVLENLRRFFAGDALLSPVP